MSSWPVIFLEANLAGGLVHSVPLFTALSLVLLKRLRQAEHSIINQKNPFFFLDENRQRQESSLGLFKNEYLDSA